MSEATLQIIAATIGAAAVVLAAFLSWATVRRQSELDRLERRVDRYKEEIVRRVALEYVAAAEAANWSKDDLESKKRALRKLAQAKGFDVPTIPPGEVGPGEQQILAKLELN